MLRYILNTLTSTLHHAVLDGDDEDVLRFLLILLACVSMFGHAASQTTGRLGK